MSQSDHNTAKTILHEIAEHAYSLAMGLQNAAPPNVSQKSNTVQYLLETAMLMENASRKIEEWSADMDAHKGFGPV